MPSPPPKHPVLKSQLPPDAALIQSKLDALYRQRELIAAKAAGLTQRDIDVRGECEESLSVFLQHAWKYMDPAPYLHNWHIECVCEHLEAVVRGELRHLLINVPPRTAKSSILSVALIPWIWAQSEIGPLSGPQVTSLYASYAQSLSFRDSAKARRLIMSPWYQRLWGSRFVMAGDQNTKSRFDTDKGGYRIATSVGGSLTGEGGQIIVGDDCHNSIDTESDLVRQGVIDWWDTAMSTRHNDPKTGVYLVVMQRLHEEDLAGHILSKWNEDWTHLMLPMRHDVDRHCVTTIGEDQRTEEGELLWPERSGEREVKALEQSLGPAATAGQLQQSPSPKGGSIFQREWWQLWDHFEYPPMQYVVASIDTAYGKDKEGDYSACTIWGVFRDNNDMPKIMMMNAWKDRLEMNPLVERVAATCKRFKVDKLLVEAKATGISVAQEIRRLYGDSAWSTQLINPKNQDKVARAYSVQHLWSEGLIYAPDRKWADEVIDEMSKFPRGKHDDLCFVAGTKIATRRGSVNIEDISLDDKILTPDGWFPVIATHVTGYKDVISRIGLIGTANHPIFTVDKGYQQLESVDSATKTVRLKLCGLMQIAFLRQLSLMERFTEEWADSENIIYRNQNLWQEGKILKGFMLLFGNLIQEKQYQKAMKLTTKMVMSLISTLIILSVYRRTCIVACLKDMMLKKTRRFLKGLDRLPLSGMGRRKGLNGTENMCKIPLQKQEGRLSAFANFVGRCLWRKAYLVQNSALIIANRKLYTGERPPARLEGRRKPAIFAKRYLLQSQPDKSFVGLDAKIETAKKQEHTEKRIVYNLAVAGPHCYFANGILVHNCDSTSQAVRYLRDIGWALRKEEQDAIADSMYDRPGKQEPLYDV